MEYMKFKENIFDAVEYAAIPIDAQTVALKVGCTTGRAKVICDQLEFEGCISTDYYDSKKYYASKDYDWSRFFKNKQMKNNATNQKFNEVTITWEVVTNESEIEFELNRELTLKDEIILILREKILDFLTEL